jgi:formate hydrogenlyase subunit 6/NADH:ubiquinone oxidoreductase subunit I
MIEVDLKKCDFCGICVACCPQNAIDLLETHWQVDEKKCTVCLICTKLCPMRALKDSDES